MDFLQGGTKMMMEDSTRALLKSRSLKKPGQKLIELQREGWGPLGYSEDVGCSALDEIDQSFPSDTALKAARDEFCMTAMRTYLQSLEDRKPVKLEMAKPIPRDTIIEFLDACNTKMDLPETHKRLVEHMMTTNQVPNTVIVEMQRDMLEVIGWEREHGCAMLGKVGQDYPTDQELHRRMQGWQQKASQACMAAVKAYQASGGELPGSGAMPGGIPHNPELLRLMQMARESIEKMTPEERGQHINLMHKKVQVFMNLPPERRMSYLDKLPEPEKIEFLKGHILLMSAMRQQMEAQQGVTKDGVMQAPAPMGMDGPGGGNAMGMGAAAAAASASASLMAAPQAAVGKPRQQEMM